jgi:hypothetical protein
MRHRLPLLLACLLGPAGLSPLAAQPSAPPRRLALVALAYDNRDEDLPVLGFVGSRGLVFLDRSNATNSWPRLRWG